VFTLFIKAYYFLLYSMYSRNKGVVRYVFVC